MTILVVGLHLLTGPLVSQSALAATAATYTVTFDGNSPTTSKYFSGDGTNCIVDGNLTYRYEVVTLTLSGNTTVTYADLFDTQDVGVGFFPSGTFNASSPTSGCVVSADDTATFRLTGPATYDVIVTPFNANVSATAKFTLTLDSTAPDPHDSTSEVTQVLPQPVHQGLPMPTSGFCTDVQDADYAWGTGLTGGWKKSWEPWVTNSFGERQGGWACTRTLVNRGGNNWIIDDVG